MEFSFAVSCPQLLASAAAIETMAGQCVPAASLPAATDLPAAGDEPDPAGTVDASDRHGLAEVRTELSDGFSEAMGQLGRTLQKTAETLRATAHDYQTTEDELTDLIHRQLAVPAEDLR